MKTLLVFQQPASDVEASVMELSLDAEPVPLKTDQDGVVRVVGSRITLDTIVGEFFDGATPEEIVHNFPALKLADVYAIVAYYLRHREEVNSYLERRAQHAAEVRRLVESRTDHQAIRERLLARQRTSVGAW
jgi:uncharacterized protein (DUF433 family)